MYLVFFYESVQNKMITIILQTNSNIFENIQVPRHFFNASSFQDEEKFEQTFCMAVRFQARIKIKRLQRSLCVHMNYDDKDAESKVLDCCHDFAQIANSRQYISTISTRASIYQNYNK